MAGNSNPVTPPPPADPGVVTITLTHNKVTREFNYHGPLEDLVTLFGMLDMARVCLIEQGQRAAQRRPLISVPTPITRR